MHRPIHPWQITPRGWWLICAALLVFLLLVGFRGNPAPQPQRVADLVSRIEALETENATQQAQIDALTARLDALAETGDTAHSVRFAPDVAIPRSWVERASSDGVLSYRHDPTWELVGDEPGTLDLWLTEDTALFFTWDWSADLLDDLHDDEEFLRFFEKDMFGATNSDDSEIVASGALEFMGETAHYWELRLESSDGFSSHMLSLFYPCSARASCNLIYAHFDPDPDDNSVAPSIRQDDWDFLNTFAHGVEFLTEGETTVAANANLRACPAIDCEITGRLVRGEIIELVAVSLDGEWYQLDSGAWIAANLVYDPPRDLPVLDDEEDI